MVDREKVIKGLTECIFLHEHPDDDAGCFECPYRPDEKGTCPTMIPFLKDVLELLKEQEPRVMALEETKAFGWDYCYLEELRLPGKEYRAVCGNYGLTCSTWPYITSMRIQHGDGNYNKTWRCWTEKPTEEQRRAVKWDD